MIKICTNPDPSKHGFVMELAMLKVAYIKFQLYNIKVISEQGLHGFITVSTFNAHNPSFICNALLLAQTKN